MGDDGWGIKASCHILDPVNFTILVSRNLSFAFFKDVPEMTVSAKLPQLKVRLKMNLSVFFLAPWRATDVNLAGHSKPGRLCYGHESSE